MRIANVLSAAMLSVLVLQANTNFAQGVAPTKAAQYTPWEPIKEVDITSRTRAWREIERENNASVFMAGKGAKSLAEVLVDGINNGSLQAYSPVDDRFTTKLEKSAGTCLKRNDLSGDVRKYLVKEDKLVVKGKEGNTVRILGIAPVVMVDNGKGGKEEQTLFWVYYPESREYLSTFPAPGNGMTWESIFEGRHFASNVTREVVTKQ